MGLFHSKSSFELLKNTNNQSLIKSMNNRTDIQQVKENKQYTNLVLSGGGVKGIAHCGGLKYLEEIGALKNITRFSGTSAGSIVAALAAVGYTGIEIEKEMMKVNFNKFVNSTTALRSIYNLATEYGWSNGGYVTELIGSLIHSKTGNCNTTFKQLFDSDNVELVICATNLNMQNSVYFHHKTSPNLPICNAVRMSMSIPFLFSPVKYKDDLIVDGGLLDNCPEHIFDGPEIGDPRAKLNLLAPNKNTIAFDILTPDDTEDFQLTKRKDIDDITQFCESTINTLVIGNERRYITPSFWSRTVGIRVPNIPLTHFTISDTQKKKLIQCGYDSCKSWFNATTF
jgi:NTE family protein